MKNRTLARVACYMVGHDWKDPLLLEPEDDPDYPRYSWEEVYEIRACRRCFGVSERWYDYIDWTPARGAQFLGPRFKWRD